jgi:hypothetical protein
MNEQDPKPRPNRRHKRIKKRQLVGSTLGELSEALYAPPKKPIPKPTDAPGARITRLNDAIGRRVGDSPRTKTAPRTLTERA